MTTDEMALTLAQRALDKSFDPEAYIVKYIAEKKLLPKPEIIEDDTGVRLSELVTSYNNAKSVETLRPLLSAMLQLFSEMYHSTSNKIEIDEMNIFINHLHEIG